MSFRLGRQVSLYGSKGQFVHGGHPRAVVLARKTMNVHFKPNGLDSRWKMKRPADLIQSQSARSLALNRPVNRPTMCTG